MAQNNFTITNKFQGYRSKADETNMEGSGFLVSGSQNVVSTDGDTVAIRGGYTLFGQAGSGNNKIRSSYEWFTHRNTELMLRSDDDELEVYDSTSDTWVRLENGWADVDFQFAEYWDTTEGQDALLFVNGSSNIYYWSGGKTTFASATVNTITKQGSTTWSEEGFLVAGTRRVLIDGIAYTYTGGEGTTTLTGVTPDPTAGGHTVGDVVLQQVRTVANSAIPGLPDTFNNDLVATVENQVWIGSLTDRGIYKSKVNDFEDFAFSAPRLVGEGLILTLDSTPTAFAPQEKVMQISAGKDFWYQTVSTLSDDLTSESIAVERLKTSPQQAALQQSAVGYTKNSVVFISNEPTLDSIGRVENIDTPQSKPMSDSIKTDFDSYDFTDAHIRYFKNSLYITVPQEGLVLVYNIERGFWEAPWTLPAGRLAIYRGDLYLHSNVTNETYKLFQGTSDAGSLPIEAIARFNYVNGGSRETKKTHDEWFSEGYITSNSTLQLDLFIEYSGSGGIITKEISGRTTQNTIFTVNNSWSLGKHALGSSKLGGSDVSNKNKFRIIHEMPPEKYYELQPQYSSNDVDQYWEVLAYGCNMRVANDDRSEIKQ